ncbi:MAG TPA: ATP-binding protein [Alphaproteobacteria bacterium]|nr:ATP-binding protein [Alphaproteobacteria bacterium]
MPTPAQTAPQPNPQPPASVNMDMQSGFALMDTCKFRIRTISEAAVLARFAAAMFRDPQRIAPGLEALMLNAIEHGCLGIGHDLKTRLLEDGNWLAEIERRQSLPENRQKSAEVVIARRPEGVFIVITDPGAGFDWKSWTSIEPARARDSHGRGIARARAVSFDNLAYNAAGNQVALHVRDAPPAKW